MSDRQSQGLDWPLSSRETVHEVSPQFRIYVMKIEVIAAHKCNGTAGWRELCRDDIPYLLCNKWCCLSASHILNEVICEVRVSLRRVSLPCWQAVSNPVSWEASLFPEKGELAGHRLRIVQSTRQESPITPSRHGALNLPQHYTKMQRSPSISRRRRTCSIVSRKRSRHFSRRVKPRELGSFWFIRERHACRGSIEDSLEHSAGITNRSAETQRQKFCPKPY